MTEYKAKTIRALDRGLHVLECLAAADGATIKDLHAATGLSRATLIRILATLQANDMVWQRMADGAFLPRYRLQRLTPAPSISRRLSEVSASALERLCKETLWPSVVTAPGLSGMEVIETNVAQAYFNDMRHGPVGYQANYLRSASGRTFVAYCDPKRRTALLLKLRQSGRPGDALAHDGAAIEHMIAKTRRRGFGARAPGFGGDYDKDRSEFDDGHHSIAVPIRSADREVVGCINLSWKRRVINIRDGIHRYLGPLRAAAQRIELGLSSDP